MSLVDELEKLGQLKSQGLLSDEEFDQAKSKLLNKTEASKKSVPPRNVNYHRSSNRSSNSFKNFVEDKSSLGEAANRYVTFQIIMGIIGVIVFLIVASKMFSSSPLGNSIPSFPNNIQFELK
jgi:ElaB/YqjD/DUF883 family membrane-anchored ribosome-binding protein